MKTLLRVKKYNHSESELECDPIQQNQYLYRLHKCDVHLVLVLYHPKRFVFTTPLNSFALAFEKFPS